MFKELQKNRKGFVLVLVLGIIAIMIIMAVSIVGINVTEVMQLEDVADNLVAEELAKKYYWRKYYNILVPNSYTEVVGGRQYVIEIEIPAGPEPRNIIVNVTY